MAGDDELAVRLNGDSPGASEGTPKAGCLDGALDAESGIHLPTGEEAGDEGVAPGTERHEALPGHQESAIGLDGQGVGRFVVTGGEGVRLLAAAVRASIRPPPRQNQIKVAAPPKGQDATIGQQGERPAHILALAVEIRLDSAVAAERRIRGAVGVQAMEGKSTGTVRVFFKTQRQQFSIRLERQVEQGIIGNCALAAGAECPIQGAARHIASEVTGAGRKAIAEYDDFAIRLDRHTPGLLFLSEAGDQFAIAVETAVTATVIVQRAIRVQAGDRKIVVAVTDQNQFPIALAGQVMTAVITTEADRRLAVVVKGVVGGAIGVVTRHREIVIAADIGASTDDDLVIGLDQNRVGKICIPAKVGGDKAALPKHGVQFALCGQAQQQEVAVVFARNFSGSPDHNDLPVGLKGHIVRMNMIDDGIRGPNRDFAIAAAECPIPLAVGQVAEDDQVWLALAHCDHFAIRLERHAIRIIIFRHIHIHSRLEDKASVAKAGEGGVQVAWGGLRRRQGHADEGQQGHHERAT
jgi:hypothetical protein